MLDEAFSFILVLLANDVKNICVCVCVFSFCLLSISFTQPLNPIEKSKDSNTSWNADALWLNIINANQMRETEKFLSLKITVYQNAYDAHAE